MNLKKLVLATCIAAALLTVAGCSISTSSNVPGFLSNDTVTQIVVTNNQTGQKGVASNNADNLNELLDTLHWGDLTTSMRTAAPQPTTSAYRLVAYDNTTVVWSLYVRGAPESSRVYISDATHPANSGDYPLKQPIKSSDLDQFISKYPA